MSVSTMFDGNGGRNRVSRYQITNKGLVGITSFTSKLSSIGTTPLENMDNYSSSISYIVNHGDTITSIAKKFGLRPEVIYADNRALLGENSEVLVPGQELLIRSQLEGQTEVPISHQVGETILPEGEDPYFETTPDGAILDTPEYRHYLERQKEEKIVDVSKYNSLEEKGFIVTTGNKTFSLEDADIDLLTAITAAECDKSYDDALAVISVILNRCEAENWVYSHGENPVSQATAPNQFVVYQEGYYKEFINGNAPEEVKTAVRDALGGVRNHSYLSFRSNGTTGYSNNQITSTGNRYR